MSALAMRRPLVGAAAAMAFGVVAAARIDPGTLGQWLERVQRLPALTLAQPERASLALAGGKLGELRVTARVVQTRALPTSSPIVAIAPWRGMLAVASFDDGVWLLDGEDVLPLEVGTMVNDLVASPDALYVATNDGAFRIEPSGRAAQLSEGVFTAVAMWRGQPWFAGTRGIATVDRLGFVTYGAEHGLEPTRPDAIADCGAVLCIGAEDGLWLFDGEGAVRRSSAVRELPADDVTAVAFDGSSIWAGTFDAGLARLGGDRARLMSPGDGIADGRIAPHALASWHDLVLAGTPTGLEVIRGDAATRLGDPLPAREVSAVSGDLEGVWVGFAGGIARLDLEAP